MKKYINLSFIIATAFLLNACDKSQDFLRDNTITTGVGYAPVSNNTLTDYNAAPIRNLGTSSAGASSYAAGTNLNVELTFFSQSPVKETNFYNTIGSGTKTLVATYPYAPAFSVKKGVDTLMIPYTIPASAAAGTVIRLDYEVVNQNALKVVRTAYVKRT
jgi:hypothetical protein